MSADDAMSVASVASILQVYAFDPPKKVPAERLRDLTRKYHLSRGSSIHVPNVIPFSRRVALLHMHM